jgi:hypothetical protein
VEVVNKVLKDIPIKTWMIYVVVDKSYTFGGYWATIQKNGGTTIQYYEELYLKFNDNTEVAMSTISQEGFENFEKNLKTSQSIWQIRKLGFNYKADLKNSALFFVGVFTSK